VMWKYFQFLYDRRFAGCQAGRRFLVVNPDGMLTPCAMVWAKYSTQQEMLEQFTAHNTCEQCFISTRSSTEKTFTDFVADNWDDVKAAVLRSTGRGRARTGGESARPIPPRATGHGRAQPEAE